MKTKPYRFNWSRFIAKRVYAWLVVLTVLAIFHIVNVMTSDNRKLVFQLESTTDSSQINQISTHLGIVQQYELQVDSPNWFYNLLLENNVGMSPLTTLVTLILASLGLVLRGEIDLKNPFNKDLSKPIFVAAIAALLLFILEYLAYRSISQSIELQQLGRYRIVRIDNFWLCFTSLGLFWLASVMKKGYYLQKEQNLTI
jgi:ABC-type dipeptide/oligopeptide/nickel transport system permease component